jgi:tRNA modification GTPase
MQTPSYDPQDPIAALATPWGESALAVLRLSGAGSLRLLSALFQPAGGRSLEAEAPGHSLHHGRLLAPVAGGEAEMIDEVLVAVYRGPRSYTGEDGAEIFLHGSPVIVRRALGALQQGGFRFAGPGEFTLRAFLNGKLDLTQAEAVNELIRARTDRARALALHRLSGAVEERIRRVKEAVAGMLSAVEVRIDYPEEDLPGQPVPEAEIGRWEEELGRLCGTYRIGRVYQEGIAVVLAGRTNSGKSTLFNRLLREDRAIVSELHGTTRDYLEGTVAMEGIPVRLYDTAGYRDPLGEIEREGMRRTDGLVAAAQLVLYVVDGSEGLNEQDRRFLEDPALQPRLLPVWSKVDLKPEGCPEGFLPVSAREGQGIEELSRAIAARALAGLGGVEEGEPVIDSLRQKELLERALGALAAFRAGVRAGGTLDLLAVELREALDALGEITGEVTSQDILNAIFSRFCVGK